MYLDSSGGVTEGLSTDTHLASGVPGTVDGLINAHSKYGKLPFREVLQPAIDLAENGFSIAPGQAESLNSNRDVFIGRNPSGTAFVNDSLWKDGDIVVQKDLAETIKRIRDNGREGFYSGETARLILKEMKRGNGIISGKDLSEYKSVSRNPVTTDYRGFKIITVPPPSGGGIILIQLLEMVEPYPLKEMGFHSTEAIHLIAEAEKRSFADRSEFAGDPDFCKLPDITNNAYLINRMATFDRAKATDSQIIKPGIPVGYENDETTHFSIVDYEGNSVAVTTTLNGTFGNSIVVDSAGFLLNNEMDDFSVKPGYPNMYGLAGGDANSIKPGKRMLSSMTPVIVEKDGKLYLIAGSPGGSTIPTSVFQTVVNVIDYNMDIQKAVDAGRFHHQWLPDCISYEKNKFDTVVLQDLMMKGHDLKPRESIGRVNAIMIHKNGRKEGGADRRGLNSSCGY
jgi:gamma-glutamyltranspeptidase/glutathione hydrolase